MTRRMQWKEASKAGAKSGAGRVCEPRSSVDVGLRKERQQVSGEVPENGGEAGKKKMREPKRRVLAHESVKKHACGEKECAENR